MKPYTNKEIYNFTLGENYGISAKDYFHTLDYDEDKLLKELIQNGYLDNKNKITAKFTKLTNSSSLELSISENDKSMLCKILNSLYDNDKQAHAFWNKLYAFSKSQSTLKPNKNFDGNINGNIHENFWELYLAKTLKEKGLSLIRKNASNTPSQLSLPDFYLENNETKIWIEATAIGDKPIHEHSECVKDNFEQNIQDVNDPIKCSLTNLLSSKLIKYNKNIKNDPIIIALNGYKAVYGHSDPSVFTDIPWPSRIESVLYGLSEPYSISNDEKRKIFYSNLKAIKKSNEMPVEIGYFSDNKYAQVSGLIYSNVTLWQYNKSLGYDFIFFPNPLAAYDTTHIFNFCHKPKLNYTKAWGKHE